MADVSARVGQVLRGKWRLDCVLDVGGMATVYAATHRNGHRVAVKWLHPEYACRPDVRERFLKEGYVANRVGHPGAVRVLDDDEAEDGGVFLVMELLDGETLHDRMRRHGGRLSVDDVLSIADRVLDVLAAAHEKQILHRDVKPENVFVTVESEVKLLDFGIARSQKEYDQLRAPTMPGTVLGTPGFLPPEQALGRVEEIDARSDLWAVGATMFAALTGRCVHEAGTVSEQLVLSATRPAPPLSALAPALPAPVAAVVDRALSFRREDRYPSATRMHEAVHDAFHRIRAHRIAGPPQRAGAVTDPPGSCDPCEDEEDPVMVFYRGPSGRISPLPLPRVSAGPTRAR